MDKKKIATIGVVISTIILAGIAVFTAVRLYQLRQESVSPAAPESKPAAAGVMCGGIQGLVCPDGEVCIYDDGSTRAPLPDASGTCQVQTSRQDTALPLSCEVTFTLATTPPTSTPTATPSDSPTPTPTGPPTTPPTSPPTVPPGQTVTPEPALPEAGISFPTMLSGGLGLLIIIGSFVLIF